MKMRIYIITFGLVCADLVLSQGISRSQGLGLRTSYWNITGRSTKINVRNDMGESKVDISGWGGTIFYFSRAYRNLFFETSLGAISGVQAIHEDWVKSDVDAEIIIPLLAGLRYDIFATRLSGAIHPYVAAGGGPYTVLNVESYNDFSQGSDGGQETIESRMDFGWYLGGGINYVFASWFALNADLKYHFLDIPEIKDYSGLELGVGFTFMWGKRREIYEILDTRLVVENIYPAYYEFYNTYPIALMTFKNLVGYPIEVNVRCFVKGYSQKPKNSGFVRLEGGEVKDIPVTVFFGKKLFESTNRNTAILDMDVEVRAASTFREQLSTQIVIHSRNAWNGEMDKLSRFLTPEDETIRDFARRSVLNNSDSVDVGLENFANAQIIFEKLVDLDIKYLPDPNIPFYQDDYVQYASETIDAGTGDCDDLVVLYATLLESLGIQTAFVEVRDPEKELAHLYLLFNTGLKAEQGYLISENEKRYILRENSSGQNLIWIPIETTLIEQDFQTAWNSAAMSYLQEGIVRNGLTEGWVTVIDIH